MRNLNNQGQLFKNNFSLANEEIIKNDLLISQELIKKWQLKIFKFQSPSFLNNKNGIKQKSLFEDANQINETFYNLNPLTLTPLPLSFWRWPSPPHKGPALYFVMDRPTNLDFPLILYIGETIAAEKRWKGEHDCKTYLSSYCEALGIAQISHQLSIRFWNDVPQDTKSRRKIEQLLIQKWKPPFNKETRNRWKTPFTTGI